MNINPYEFEELLSELWEEMGYETYRTAKSNDKGVDVVAEGDNRIAIQAKRHRGNIGSPKVREMVGSIEIKNADEGILVTTSDFTKEAEQTAEEIENVRLIDGDELVDMLREHGIPTRKYA
jgi:restriction system protein